MNGLNNLKRNSMEKYFATYNQSLALKELGFDEDCLGRWLAITEWEKPTGEIKLQLGVKAEDYDKNQCLAPLKSQVFRWFREKHNLYHTIHHFEHKKDTPEEFLSEVSGKLLMGNDDISGFSYHSTYNDAESACIDKLIEILQNDK